jgi:hypothetical protein
VSRLLCQEIRRALKEGILSPLKFIKREQSQIPKLADIVKDKSTKENKQFIESFVETQMFNAYVDETFN